MPTTDQPCAACHRDSARVEKRGPSITTSVPPSTGSQSRPRAAVSAAARPAGQYGSAKRHVHDVRHRAVRERQPVEVGLRRGPSYGRPAGPGTSSVPGPYSGRRPPTAHGPSTWRTPDRAQGPQVGAVVDAVRRQMVAAAVPGQEGDPAAGDLAEEQGVAGRPYGVSTWISVTSSRKE